MQDRSGYSYYRCYPLITAKTPYFHWGQATMYKGLAHLLSRLGKQDAIPLAKCTQQAVA
jgi:hypothetical protein